LKKYINITLNITRQSYHAYLFNCKRRSFLITTFIIAFLISSLALTGILSDNVSMGTERVPAEMIHTASASSEGGGDGDSGGDQGEGDQNGDEGGGETDGNADFQPDSDTDVTETTDEETETTDEETEPEPEPTPQLDVTPEPSPTPQGLTNLVEICDNGQDDDNDGQIDADDSNCTQQTSSILTLKPTPAPTLAPTLTPSSTLTPTNIQGLFGTITPSPTPDSTLLLRYFELSLTPEPTPGPAATP
jgi:hypothetical protein